MKNTVAIALTACLLASSIASAQDVIFVDGQIVDIEDEDFEKETFKNRYGQTLTSYRKKYAIGGDSGQKLVFDMEGTLNGRNSLPTKPGANPVVFGGCLEISCSGEVFYRDSIHERASSSFSRVAHFIIDAHRNFGGNCSEINVNFLSLAKSPQFKLNMFVGEAF